MVFTDRPGIDGTTYVGNRDTSPIYFLQLMVRYGLIWGRISPGDDHQMGHFLEEDMPGFLAITEDLPPLKYLIALGLMKLGAPAVVPPSFPFPYGNRVVAETPEEIVEKGSRFPNLRQRYFRSEVVQLPPFCNPAWVSETVRTGVCTRRRCPLFLLRSARPGDPEKTDGRWPARSEHRHRRRDRR